MIQTVKVNENVRERHKTSEIPSYGGKSPHLYTFTSSVSNQINVAQRMNE